MPESVPALVDPELLQWARKTAGLDLPVAARKIGQKAERLADWEAGKSSPSVAQLRVMARVYRRPLAVFYLSTAPKDFDALRDFRRLPGDFDRRFSTELRFLVRSARERQSWLSEVVSDVEGESLGFVGSARPDAGVESVAARIRDVLAVSLSDQQSWGSVGNALRHWVDSIEAAGIFVFQSGQIRVDPTEMRGFFLSDVSAPVVVLNSKDVRVARIFTLMHEVCHVLLGAEGVSNLRVPRRVRSEEDTIEVFCNAVAAETLVPAVDLSATLRAVPVDDVDGAIEVLVRRYKVSREVIARRLRDTGVITNAEYARKRRQYQKEWLERTGEQETQPPRIPWARRVVSANGRALTRMVLSAYGSGFITGRDVSALLNTKLKHLAGIEKEVFPVSFQGVGA